MDSRACTDFGPFTIAHSQADGALWIINTLGGPARRLEVATVQRLQESPDSPDRVRLLGDLREDRLLGDTAVERAFFEGLAAARPAPPHRVGFWLDAFPVGQAEAAVEHALGAAPIGAELMLYLWYFASHGIETLPEVLRAWAERADRVEGLRLALHTDGAEPVCNETVASLERLPYQAGGSIVVFSITEEAVRSTGGARAYCAQLFDEHARYFNLGLAPYFVFRCTRHSLEFLLGEVFEAFCFSGLYPRNLYVVPIRSNEGSATACDLYDWDWELYRRLALRLREDPRLGVFEPLGAGLPDKLRALLRDGQEAPTVQACPFGAGGVFFGERGQYGPCPVAAGRRRPPAASRAGALGERADTEFDPRAWSGRSTATVPGCRTCRVAPLCGSGCPLEAVERLGTLTASPCPPVLDILETELAGEHLAPGPLPSRGPGPC